ncbi:MAG: PD-(D/E)XK motif protein [Pseudomonadota bacterium]
MARPSKEFDLAWASLAGASAEQGWRTIRIDSAGSVRIHVGRRFPGNDEALLVCFSVARLTPGEKLPDGQGFSVERADPVGDGNTWLALTRKASGSVELFSAMACDVAGALDLAAAEGADEHRSLRVFLGRVRAWQEFMRKGATALSPEAEIGLIGELLTLAAIIDAGVPAHVAVASWVGPLDGVQDFEIGTGAMEVKTTIATVGFTARIGSLEQLDDAVLQPLFVVGAKLKQVASGKNLPLLVADLKAGLAEDSEATRLFSERLIAAGFFDSHADRYPRNFEPASLRAILVGEGFPRLIHGTVPQGITRANYDIDLDKSASGSLDLAAALKQLGAI